MKTLLTLLVTVITGLSAFAANEAPKPYPLQTCVVTGEKLGEMGKPITLVYEGQEVKFCCGGCVKKFKADPAKYLKEIQAAEKK